MQSCLIFEYKEVKMKDSELKEEKNSRQELERYIDQTNEIRKLSSVQISEIDGADSYYESLVKNFTRIGELAKDNEAILEKYFFPNIDGTKELDRSDIDEMWEFSHALTNAYQLNNLDSPLVYLQTKKLLEVAETMGDDEALILALDGMVTASYLMVSMTSRLVPASDICLKYHREGLEAGERLLEYLDHERFLTLSDELKELIVINARYIRVVSEVDEIKDTPEQRELNLKRMKDALAIADDPFYLKQLPSYNWDLHKFRTYEYICTFTDLNNDKECTKEQIEYVNDITKKMKAMYESASDEFKANHFTHLLPLFSIRNAYLAGETSIEDYKKELEEMIFKDYREKPTDNVPVIMLLAPLEYMLLLNPDDLTPGEESRLNYCYRKMITYMHQTPKKDYLTFLLSCVSWIMRGFIDFPGGMDFETLCVGLLAAILPQSYVHIHSVAAFAKVITGHLLKREPELFVGMPGYDTLDDVVRHKAEIEDFAYHASICHDFGKILIADTIHTYGRKLIDDEMECIRAHPSLGAYLISKHADTAPYEDIARGHHKWFNDKGGYPADFSFANSPYKTMISIIACADCLDAATDSIGRSYKKGKTLDEFIEELEEGSGTRYAPYLFDLLSEPSVKAELEDLIVKVREENYRKTYFALKKYEKS